MKTNMKTETQQNAARRQNRKDIEDWYFEFTQDYPKNREKVLGYFDAILNHFAENPRIAEYFARIKAVFLEVDEKHQA